MKRIILAICLLLGGYLVADLESMRARVPKVAELKDKGEIGEQADGYLGVVKDSAAARAIVDEENRDRRQEYATRASQQSQKPDVIAKVLGEARIKSEKPGRFVKGDSGNWAKK